MAYRHYSLSFTFNPITWKFRRVLKKYSGAVLEDYEDVQVELCKGCRLSIYSKVTSKSKTYYPYYSWELRSSMYKSCHSQAHRKIFSLLITWWFCPLGRFSESIYFGLNLLNSCNFLYYVFEKRFLHSSCAIWIHLLRLWRYNNTFPVNNAATDDICVLISHFALQALHVERRIFHQAWPVFAQPPAAGFTEFRYRLPIQRVAKEQSWWGWNLGCRYHGVFESVSSAVAGGRLWNVCSSTKSAVESPSLTVRGETHLFSTFS